MDRRILKTDSWEQPQHSINSAPKVRMSEEIAKNISNNLVNRRTNFSVLQTQFSSNGQSNTKASSSFLKKSREISFNNNLTNQTIISDFLDSTSKYASFGESFSRNGISSFDQNPKFIGQPSETKNNIWNNSHRRSQTRPNPRGTNTNGASPRVSGKENVNFINSGIIRSNFTLNPENEYNTRHTRPKLTCVSEEMSDQSSTWTHEPSLRGKRGIGDGSTVSSTVHSKLERGQENMFALSIRRFSNKLKNVESQDGIEVRNGPTSATGHVQTGNAYFKDFGQKSKTSGNRPQSGTRKTESKHLNKPSTVKAIILDSVGAGQNEPIQVFNLQVETRPKKMQKQGKRGKTDRNRKNDKRKKRSRNRGEISGKCAQNIRRHSPDPRIQQAPQIRIEMARMGLKTKCASELGHFREQGKRNTTQGAQTEKAERESNAFGFSKRNLSPTDGESNLHATMDDHSISKHNKFIRTGRKQRSNIKINFGQSLTPKNQFIRGQRSERVMRKSKSIGGKRLFEAMERHKIGEEVQKRMQATRERVPKVPVKIRSHDDVMKKSADFISGINMSNLEGTNASLAESILKKKEISQVSLDFNGA